MADEVLVYISAAPDLQREREILGQAVTEVPVTLGWRVVQSPRGDAPADLVPLLKRGVLQTPAAQSFQRYVEEQVAWRPFRDGAELRL